MDFNKYAKGVTGGASGMKKGTHNYDHLMDPYIRRYHIVKVGLQSLVYGLMVHAGKSMVENMYIWSKVERTGNSIKCRPGWSCV